MKDIEYMYEIINKQIKNLKPESTLWTVWWRKGDSAWRVKRDKRGRLSRGICVTMPKQKPFVAVTCLLL